MLSDALVTACKLVRSVQTKALPSECHDSRQDPAGALYASYPAGASRSSYASPRHLPLRGRFSARGRSSSGRPTPRVLPITASGRPPRGRPPARPLPARPTSPRGRPPRAADLPARPIHRAQPAPRARPISSERPNPRAWPILARGQSSACGRPPHHASCQSLSAADRPHAADSPARVIPALLTPLRC